VDGFDFFGRPIKVVDEKSPSNCCHAMNIPEWPSAKVRLSACLKNVSACRRFDPPFTPVSREIATLSEAFEALRRSSTSRFEYGGPSDPA
jgi:hypothetical protein